MSKKIFSLLLVVVMLVGCLAGCRKKDKGVEYQPIDLADVVSRTDYTSVYDVIGSKVTIDMVEENADGLAFVTVDGVKYELGMDFLSMAMVYNTSVPESWAAQGKTAEDVYNTWFKLYTIRWNYLVAEIPLYSNEYYDLYNAKITGFETTPFWGAADAIVSATIAGENTSVILGSATALSGAFRNASWGKSSPGASDLDIQNLTTGHSTMMTNKQGAYEFNMNALASEPVFTNTDNGTLVVTITVKDNLKFSDGSAINAKNYIAGLLANSTAVAKAAGGSGKSGLYFEGFDAFNAYEGGEVAEGASRYFSGVKLLGDYTFSVEIAADYANYYYANTYAAFSPDPLALYLGSNDIIVDEATKACGLSDGFYAKADKDGAQAYTMADVIKANLKWNSALPYSGPYVIANYDEANLIATLTLNPNYTGDVRGTATIGTISYIKVETATQMDKFTQGEVDVIEGITGGNETKAALAAVAANPDKYKETHYARAGYGKMGFRADFGAAQDVAVRQAIMYTLNRNEFAQAFTGGYGSVVHGAYYTQFPAYIANKADLEAKLDPYAFSIDNAIDVLEAAGWVYNAKGKEFNPDKDDVRYKKLSGYELSKANLEFKSTDSKYKTVKIDGEYYMPLVINWYGTQPNDVTDLLITSWQETDAATKDIGMYITYTSCDFTSGLYGEYYQIPNYGFDGVPKLSCINFATGFNSALYDYAYGWTINPKYYDDYSQYYIMDEADFYSNYAK